MKLTTWMTAAAMGLALQASAAVAQTGSSDVDAFYAFLEDAFEESTMESPLALTSQGRRERMTEIDDLSDEANFAQLEIVRRQLDALHSFDYDSLPRNAQISYLIFETQSQRALDGAAYYRDGYPINQMFMFPQYINAILGTQHPVSDLESAEAYVTRVGALEVAFGQVADNIQDRTEYGVIPPSFLYPEVINAMNLLQGLSTPETSDQHPLYSTFAPRLEALDIPEADKTRILSDLRAAIEGPVSRGYARIIEVSEAAAPLATTSDGIWRHPNGEAYYAYLAENYTQSGMSPAELHEFGLAEVERIENEMRGIMAEVGFDGTLAEFRQYLMTDPQFAYENTEEGREQFLAESRAAAARVMAAAPEYFNILPQAELEIRRIEEFREASAPRAYYSQPAPDGSRPGIFWSNLRNMEEWSTIDMEALVFHEAAPGHHFQLAITQELEDVPTFQNFFFDTAYAEGWGVYAERLAGEMGLYSSPYSRFGGLNSEVWRAVRVVVDTGIHHHRWDEEQAIAYMVEHSTLPRDAVVSEVRRYLTVPGQALAYKMGMTRILELRARTREALGDDFDIAEFHDVVLSSGGVPLNVLEMLVDDYIESQS